MPAFYCDVNPGAFRAECELVATNHHAFTKWILQWMNVAEAHPRIAFAKELIEHIVHAKVGKYVDIGGNWFRQGVQRGEEVWCISPILDNADEQRERKRQKSRVARDRYLAKTGKPPTTYLRCKHRAEDCVCTTGWNIGLMNHSCYNMTLEQFVAICEKFELVYVVVHNLPVNGEGELIGQEMSYSVKDGVCVCKAKANDNPYTHPWPLPFQHILDQSRSGLWDGSFETTVYLVRRHTVVSSTLPSRAVTPVSPKNFMMEECHKYIESDYCTDLTENINILKEKKIQKGNKNIVTVGSVCEEFDETLLSRVEVLEKIGKIQKDIVDVGSVDVGKTAPRVVVYDVIRNPPKAYITSDGVTPLTDSDIISRSDGEVSDHESLPLGVRSPAFPDVIEEEGYRALKRSSDWFSNGIWFALINLLIIMFGPWKIGKDWHLTLTFLCFCGNMLDWVFRKLGLVFHWIVNWWNGANLIFNKQIDMLHRMHPLLTADCTTITVRGVDVHYPTGVLFMINEQMSGGAHMSSIRLNVKTSTKSGDDSYDLALLAVGTEFCRTFISPMDDINQQWWARFAYALWTLVNPSKGR
jgi:hypothetical protein